MNVKDWFKRNRIIIIMIVVVLFFVVVLGYFILYGQYGYYERNIQRNVDNIEESNVLEIVENYSYGDVFEMERFLDGGQESWANFIDYSVIDHYNSEFERLRDQSARHNVYFTYKAEVYKIDELNIMYNYTPESVVREYPNGDIEVEGDEYTLELQNSSESFIRIEEEFFPDIMAEFNGTNLTYYDHEFSFEINFSDVYLVHLFLDYSDSWGPLAGYGVKIHQIMIMAQGNQPLFTLIDTHHWIS